MRPPGEYPEATSRGPTAAPEPPPETPAHTLFAPGRRNHSDPTDAVCTHGSSGAEVTERGSGTTVPKRRFLRSPPEVSQEESGWWKIKGVDNKFSTQAAAQKAADIIQKNRPAPDESTTTSVQPMGSTGTRRQRRVSRLPLPRLPRLNRIGKPIRLSSVFRPMDSSSLKPKLRKKPQICRPKGLSSPASPRIYGLTVRSPSSLLLLPPPRPRSFNQQRLVRSPRKSRPLLNLPPAFSAPLSFYRETHRAHPGDGNAQAFPLGAPGPRTG